MYFSVVLVSRLIVPSPCKTHTILSCFLEFGPGRLSTDWAGISSAAGRQYTVGKDSSLPMWYSKLYILNSWVTVVTEVLAGCWGAQCGPALQHLPLNPLPLALTLCS